MECLLVVVLLNLSFVLAGKLIYNDAFPFGTLEGVLMYAVISALAIIILGAYKYFSFIGKPFTETSAKIITIVILLNFIFIAVLYFSRSIRLSPFYFVVADTLQITFLLLIKRFSELFKTKIMKNRISLVIGKNKLKNELLKTLRNQGVSKLAFISFEEGNLESYLDRADDIYLAGFLTKKLKDQIISYCVLKNKRVFIVPETYEIAMRNSEMTQIGDIPLFAIESFRLTEAQNMIKRLLDITLSILGIIFSLPIIIFAAVRIKMEDGGPIFYTQVRSGLNGKEFKVIKFRSMVVDAEKETGAIFAAEKDSRITKIGQLMRATRIDEIPQFFNVLAGSMSIIGPRPERPVFVEAFSKELPEYTNRLAVKPGITGLAQVMGNYTTTAENKIKFDLVYIRDYSLLLDIKILFKTVQVVFTREQAEGFSKQKDETTYDIAAEIASKETLKPNKGRRFNESHRIAKVILVTFCCLIVICGSMFLRYSALAMTMMEAAAQPTLEETPRINQPQAENQQALDTEVVSEQNQTDNIEQPTEAQTISNELTATTEDITVNQQKEEVVLSQAAINSAVESMSMGEKMQIAYKLVSKLSATDLIILEKLAENGFTVEEKATAKEMMYEYFNDTEVQYIKEIYWEYVK